MTWSDRASGPTPPHTMAAMITFNPLALAARAPAASRVGASARRVASPKMATRVSNARKVSFARAAKV